MSNDKAPTVKGKNQKFFYTRHAEDKLQEIEAKKFQISKNKLEVIIEKPQVLQDVQQVKRAMGKLDSTHSLCVIYKQELDAIKIITFFPAEKGRYEN